MFADGRNDFACSCCWRPLNFHKTFFHVIIHLNIFISLLSSVQCDNTKLVIASSSSVIEHFGIQRTTSVFIKDNLKRNVNSSQISYLSTTSSKPVTNAATSSSNVIRTSTSKPIFPLTSTAMESLKRKTSMTTLLPVLTTSIKMNISSSSSQVTKILSTSTVHHSLSNISSSSSTKNSTVTQVSTSAQVLTSLSSSITATEVLNSTSIKSSSILMNSSTTPPSILMNTSTMHTQPHQITPSFVVNSTSLVNSTSVINVSSSIIPSNLSSGVLSTVVLNSTIIPSPSMSRRWNITSTMHSGNVSWSSPTFIMSSTFVCPTTTVYINCSSDYIITPTPSAVNFTSRAVNITSSAVNITSSSVNTTSTVTNFTSRYITSTIHSVVNFTSTTYITSILTSLPVFTSSLLNSTTILPTQISSIINVTSSSTVMYSSAQIIIPPIKKCDVYLSEFTDSSNELSRCILHNMHPMGVCSNCSKAYDSFSKHHKKIFKDCGKTLIYDYNLQYQVIPKMFASQEMTWKSLECDKCYKRDESGVNEYSPQFKAFIDLHDKLNVCFNNHTHESWVQLPNTTIQNTTYDEEICFDCYDLYHKMQVHYEYYGDGDGDGGPTKWCADINVAVNETRHRWSNDFKCGKKEKDLESVIALTCLFCFLPIVFYVGAKLHADVRERKSANRFTYDSE